MKTSEQGLDLLIEREAKRNAAYLDSRGIPTIGIGHTGPEVHMGLVWSDGQVKEAFAIDIERFEHAVNVCVGVPLKQHQFDALVSFEFNAGENALSAGNHGGPAGILRALNTGNYAGAAAAFDNWHVPPEVSSRRNGEKHQFIGDRFEARIP